MKEMFIETEDSTYFAKILTRRDGEDVIGTIGMAWDVSSNITMLGTLSKILDIELQKKEPDQNVIDLTTNAISCSRLKVLIERLYNK